MLTDGRDSEHLARGIYDAYTTLSLRYFHTARLTMRDEKNTGSNLPGQIQLYATDGDAYKFLFVAEGGEQVVPVVCRARLALQLWPRKSTAMSRAMMTVLKANATRV